MFRSFPRPLKSTVLGLAVAIVCVPSQSRAHCEVPCGIFSDQLRFQSMLEDQETIAKAIDQLEQQLQSMSEGVTPLAANQATRWINTKEEHAVRIQETIARYFMAQRIKPADGDGAADYVKKLTAAHAVMRAAMKSKQDPTAESAAALRTAILDFYRAYEGKEPVLH